MFVCTYGEQATEDLHKLKSVISSQYPKQVGNSDVHFERPMIADNGISYIRLFDKTAGNMLYNGKVKFDKDNLVEFNSNKEVLK